MLPPALRRHRGRAAEVGRCYYSRSVRLYARQQAPGPWTFCRRFIFVVIERLTISSIIIVGRHAGCPHLTPPSPQDGCPAGCLVAHGGRRRGGQDRGSLTEGLATRGAAADLGLPRVHSHQSDREQYMRRVRHPLTCRPEAEAVGEGGGFSGKLLPGEEEAKGDSITSVFVRFRRR